MAGYDVVVVGGGTAGAVAARAAAAVGAHTLLLDEGTPPSGKAACAGLVSRRALDVLEASSDVVLRPIRGVTVHAPHGASLHVRAEETRALVVDRGALEQELLAAAVAAGVELLTPARVRGYVNGRVSFERAGETAHVATRMVIGADGAPSAVARWLRLDAAQQLLPAAQALVETEEKGDRQDEVVVFLGRQTAPGFFAWCVPAEPGVQRVGLACLPSVHPRPLLDRLLAERFRGRVLRRVDGRIPVGPPATAVTEGGLLVGDAAAQVKPFSGGGICLGAQCARVAGQVAGWAALAGDVSANALGAYERRWREEVGHEISFGWDIHRLRIELSDEQLAAAVRAAADPELLEVVAREGDIDRLGRLVDALVARRDLWPRLLGVASALGHWGKLVDLAQRAARLDPTRPL